MVIVYLRYSALSVLAMSRWSWRSQPVHSSKVELNPGAEFVTNLRGSLIPLFRRIVPMNVLELRTARSYPKPTVTPTSSANGIEMEPNLAIPRVYEPGSEGKNPW